MALSPDIICHQLIRLINTLDSAYCLGIGIDNIDIMLMMDMKVHQVSTFPDQCQPSVFEHEQYAHEIRHLGVSFITTNDADKLSSFTDMAPVK